MLGAFFLGVLQKDLHYYTMASKFCSSLYNVWKRNLWATTIHGGAALFSSPVKQWMVLAVDHDIDKVHFTRSIFLKYFRELFLQRRIDVQEMASSNFERIVLEQADHQRISGLINQYSLINLHDLIYLIIWFGRHLYRTEIAPSKTIVNEDDNKKDLEELSTLHKQLGLLLGIEVRLKNMNVLV